MTTAGTVGWFPDPTPTHVVAPGWGETPPEQTDPLIEVGWWALVVLDARPSLATGTQALALMLIQGLSFSQTAAAAQSLVLQKVAALQLTNTAPATQTLAVQRVITLDMGSTAAGTQTLELTNNQGFPYTFPFRLS